MLICNDRDIDELKSNTIKKLNADVGKVRARLVDELFNKIKSLRKLFAVILGACVEIPRPLTRQFRAF